MFIVLSCLCPYLFDVTRRTYIPFTIILGVLCLFLAVFDFHCPRNILALSLLKKCFQNPEIDLLLHLAILITLQPIKYQRHPNTKIKTKIQEINVNKIFDKIGSFQVFNLLSCQIVILVENHGRAVVWMDLHWGPNV